MSTATTQIIISGKDQLSGVVADAGRRMGTELEGMRRQVLTVNTALAGFAGYFTGGALAAGVKEVSMLAARYDTLGVVMGVVGNNAGYTRAEMDQFEASLRKTGITALESRNNLASMASANIDLSKAAQLARMAQDAAVVGNMNSSEAFKQMIYGIKSAQVEVLRTIGINVSFENSYKKVADQLGKNTTELTEQEKTQARLNAVLAQAPTIAGVYEESLTTVGKKLASTARYSEDARVKVGAIFQPALVLLVDTYTDALKGVNAELDNTAVIEKWARVIKSEVLDIMQIATSLNMVLAKAGQAATVVGMGVYGPGAALRIDNSERGFEYFAKQNLEYQKQFADSEAYLNKLIEDQANLGTTIKKQTADNITEQARISAGNARRAEEAAAILAGNGGTNKKATASSQKNYEKMITDGKKAAEVLDQYWDDYEGRRVSAIVEGTAARVSAVATEREAIDELTTWGAYSAQAMEDTVSTAFQGMGDAIVDFAMTGKMEFSDFADSIIRDMMRIVVQQQIVGPLGGAAGNFLSGLFSGPSTAAGSVSSGFNYAGELSSFMSRSANGNVFSGPGISEFSNSIVTKPTQFWANGGHLMGEAGPEAIMPLTRMSNNDLGVKVSGGGGFVVNIIESPGNGGKTQSRQENGVNILDVMVEQIKSSIASDINRGSGVVPQAITKSYGLSRAPGAY